MESSGYHGGNLLNRVAKSSVLLPRHPIRHLQLLYTGRTQLTPPHREPSFTIFQPITEPPGAVNSPPVNSQVEYGARYPTLALRIDSGAAPSTAKAFTLFSQISMIPEVDHGAALVSDIMSATSTSVVFNSMSGISSTKSCWASDVNGYFYWIGMGAGFGQYPSEKDIRPRQCPIFSYV